MIYEQENFSIIESKTFLINTRTAKQQKKDKKQENYATKDLVG